MAGTTYGIPNGLTYAQFVAYMVSVGFSATDPSLPEYYANYIAAGGGVVTPPPVTPPPVTPPPTTPPAGNFVSLIRDWFLWATQQLVNAALWAYGVPLLGSGLGDILNNLSTFTSRVGGYLCDAAIWVNDIQTKIGNFLSWDIIWSYILSYVPNITSLNSWFSSWWSNVTSVIASWWSATSATVQGWIAIAVSPFNSMLTAWSNFWSSLWPQLTSAFNSLQSAWSNFWLVTFPNLVNFSWLTTWWNSQLLGINALIESRLKEWFPFYDDLARLWGDIAEFVSNPVEYIWHRFTDWFFGGS